ncbi:hypothetical protein ERO13_D04G112050v2 [Gossypium hirsutum]|uniref:Uncharacterized protein n=1 Tax=Gossypium darwinii TaxID=34276 RepID=A0A5D2CWE0_GOSDA|nr:hypothetical protein ERO13_D04G112050v2 [Gossypium hirsutum]TYG73881.1 hypothetical protein ES288_D04G137200v1 [Gossypium darwinii]
MHLRTSHANTVQMFGIRFFSVFQAFVPEFLDES